MSRQTGIVAIRNGLLALALLMSGPGWAADAARQTPAAGKPDDELGEVLVEGSRQKAKRPSFDDYQAPWNFMARLVGQFVIDGTVELHAQGRSEELRKVSGRTECVGFGQAPSVHCELRVRWPETAGPNGEAILGGVSTLNPAVVLYGYEPVDPNMVGRRPRGRPAPLAPGMPAPTTPEEPGISWVVVDNQGVVETAVGQMISPDTMRSRSKCLAVPGNCERDVRITAAPNLKTVGMNIDLVIDGEKAVSFAFVLHRVPGTESVVYGRKPRKEQEAREKAEQKARAKGQKDRKK